MRYEVEQKYRCRVIDSVRRRIVSLGAHRSDEVQQVDTYFSHPGRDFAATDEALRIRRVEQDVWITYKGPKIDATTKTRSEIEIRIADGEDRAEACRHLLESLSFRRVNTVCKTRERFRIEWENHEVEIALDNVDQVGQFIELETLADGQGALEPAQKAIAALAGEIGLLDPERRSYLELLLKTRPG